MSILFRYYIRVHSKDYEKFTDHLERNGIIENLLSVDIGAGHGSYMYSLNLTDDQASALKLSFDLIGCINLTEREQRKYLRTKQVIM